MNLQWLPFDVFGVGLLLIFVGLLVMELVRLLRLPGL